MIDQPDTEHARNYWKVLKHRLKKEGAESVTNCNQLKLQANDGKRYKTDVADTEQIFRIIQSTLRPRQDRSNGGWFRYLFGTKEKSPVKGRGIRT